MDSPHAGAQPAAAPAGSDPTAKHDERLIRRLAVAMLLVSCAVPLALNVADPDLWGHVRYGQDWIAEGQLHRTATHTYTAEGTPWVNHENLAELLLATGFPLLGVPGMLVVKCVLGLAILGLMWRSARRHGVGHITCWALLLVVATNLQAFFPMRPQLLSFLWCTLMLFALERAFAAWDRDDPDHKIGWAWLAALPPLFAVWVNSHGGFVAGLAILGALLMGRGVQLFWREGINAWSRNLGLIAVLVACGAATLANPYGLGLHEWIAGSLGVDRPEITEWQPPRPGSPVFVPFVTLVATAFVALAFTAERRDPVRLAILALVGWQAAEHLRHIAFFALLCGFWLPTHAQSVVQRVRDYCAQGLPTASLARWQRALVVFALSATIAAQSVAVADRLKALPVYFTNYPVDAIHWMADQKVRGKLVVCFNWAQYAIAALAPDVRVGFDGRFRTCYPQELIDMHFDFLVGDLAERERSPQSGPIDGARVLEHGEPDYVLVDRRYPNVVEVMRQVTETQDTAWSLLYQDATAQLWGRRELVDDPASDRFVSADERVINDQQCHAWAPWPALPVATSDTQSVSSAGSQQGTILSEVTK